MPAEFYKPFYVDHTHEEYGFLHEDGTGAWYWLDPEDLAGPFATKEEAEQDIKEDRE